MTDDLPEKYSHPLVRKAIEMHGLPEQEHFGSNGFFLGWAWGIMAFEPRLMQGEYTKERTEFEYKIRKRMWEVSPKSTRKEWRALLRAA